MVATGGIGGPNRFKLGIFCYNVEGSNALTTVPERWPMDWPSMLGAVQAAERYGFEFALPIARWRGYGEANRRGSCFETMTLSAGLAGATRDITLFSTVHVPLMHPVMAAKMLTTVDHASGGRAGLNITAGWNQDEFDMFGHVQEAHDDRYAQATEWFELFSRVIAGEGPFDYAGRYYRGKGIVGWPASLQQPRPPVLSAGFSPAGRDYAVRVADHLLTFLTTLEQATRDIVDVKRRAATHGRDIGVLTCCYVVCRPTRAEAEAYHKHYAEDMADQELLAGNLALKTKEVKNYPGQDQAAYKKRFDLPRLAGGNGTYPLIGSPADIAEQLIEIARAGFSGTTVSFVNFINELPYFAESVLPILEKAGLRQA